MASKFFSKALSVGLSLSLCLSLLPLSAFAVNADCQTCGGTGKVATSTVCTLCEGAGSFDELDWSTMKPVHKTCERCNGVGYLLEDCPECGGISPEECSHERYERVLAVEPTCTSKGRYDKVCCDCGKVLEKHYGRDPVPTGHKYEQTTVKEPTCEEEGLIVTACSVCGARKNNSNIKVDPLGHDLVKGETDRETGLTVYTCSRCDYEESKECQHENTSVTTDPATCLLPGYSVKTCDDCGQVISKEESESAKGHSWDNGVMYGGKKEIIYTCTACGETYSEQEIPEKPYDREVEVCMGFLRSDESSFDKEDIPEGFSVTYSYEWNGETITVELPLEKAEITMRPKAYQDENGKWIFNDETQEKYSTASWKVRIPVDPTTGEPMQGTILNVTESGHDKIDGYEWDYAFGYNPGASTDGTGVLYVPSNGSTVTWVYNVYAKTATYTVNYYYGGTLGETREGTARVGSTVTVSQGSTNYNGTTYVFSSVSGSTTIGLGDNVINVYYALPAPDTDPEEPDDPTIEITDPEIPLAGLFTRGDAIGYLWEQSGSPEADLSTFEDVPEDHVWAVAIGWAQDMGIARADEEGNFRPDDLVLRGVEDLEIDPEGELQEFLNWYAEYAGVKLDAGEFFIELEGALDDVIMGEDAQVIFDDFFARLATALSQAA